jgi:DNA-binding NarL/FixJ family response regulator
MPDAFPVGAEFDTGSDIVTVPPRKPSRPEAAPPAPAGQAPVRLLIVDDHDILRYGLRALMRGHDEVDVVGEADGVESAVHEARRLKPQVVLMDAQLGDGSGVDACREILAADPAVRVLFFSAFSDEDTVLMALLAGAAGHVAKDLQLDSLFAAILTVARGGTVFDARVREHVVASIDRAADGLRRGAEAERLSPQEERVMELVVQGKTNKEIASQLALSDKTVKNYLSNVFQKLGVARRVQAAQLYDLQRLRRAGG